MSSNFFNFVKYFLGKKCLCLFFQIETSIYRKQIYANIDSKNSHKEGKA